MRAVSLHPDVIVVTSALLQVNCVIVCGREEAAGTSEDGGMAAAARGGSVTDATPAETFVIDSPVLPEELDALSTLVAQARFPAPSGLLATHGDWDHLLGRLAFPELALGCSESTAKRLAAELGATQRELRAFDEGLLIERDRPLALGSVQVLPVPGRCEIGELELELHAMAGHTSDGMAVLIPWAGVLVAGDYLSTVELPTLSEGGDLDTYLATLEHLRGLLVRAEQIVPGHGSVLDGAGAAAILEEDVGYLRALAKRGAEAELPPSRRAAAHRRQHHENVTRRASGAEGP
jgi:glyoxylase-like metal-dependent hydrolase (beta-lactamase superfamily II)